MEKRIKMVFCTKQDLENAVLVLKAHDKYNAAYVLEDAIKQHEFDSQHHTFTLNVEDVPTMLETAASECCTTDCEQFRLGTCPYQHNEKSKCYKIQLWINE